MVICTVWFVTMVRETVRARFFHLSWDNMQTCVAHGTSGLFLLPRHEHHDAEGRVCVGGGGGGGEGGYLARAGI